MDFYGKLIKAIQNLCDKEDIIVIFGKTPDIFDVKIEVERDQKQQEKSQCKNGNNINQG